MADEVDDLLYGNLDEAPLIDSLTSPKTEKASTPPPPGLTLEKTAFESKPASSMNGYAAGAPGASYPPPASSANGSSIVSIVGGEDDRPSPATGSDARKGLRDPNVSRAGKMFIGGLSWETTEDGLTKYMQVFGEIEDCMIMKDTNTGRSRGFGFLTFKDPASIDKVLETDHYIDGKKIDPKRAVPKEQYEKAEKVFVGGLPPEVSDAEFKDFFKAFGGVSDATVMHDRETGRSRGFGFVTFTSWDGVQKLLDMQTEKGIFFREKRVEVKPAALRAQQQRMNGGMYGRGGGRGGRNDGYNQGPPMPYPPMGGGYGMYGYPSMAPDMGYYGAAGAYGYGAPQPTGYYPPASQTSPYDGYDSSYSRPGSSVGYYPDQPIPSQTVTPGGLPSAGPIGDAETALSGSHDDLQSRVGYPDYPPQDSYSRGDDRYGGYRDDYDRSDSRRSDRRDYRGREGRDSRDSRGRRDDYSSRDGGSSRRGYGGGGGSRRHPYSR